MKAALRQRRGRRSWQQGRWAERMAALWMMLKGYRILERRFKTAVGEIDLIVKRGQTLCFVEVKKRASLAEALYAITPFQEQRLRRAAQQYLQVHPFEGTLRFDGIMVTPWGWPRHLPHILL